MSAPPFGWERLLASCLGVGRLRPAPGTMGSIFALVIFVVALAGAPLAVQIAATVIATVFAIWISGRAAARIGREDPSEVVIDELAGMWLALLGSQGWRQVLLAFLAFRLLDVLKPFPARRAEALPGGWGIVVDDLVAGLYALALVRGAAAWGLL